MAKQKIPLKKKDPDSVGFRPRVLMRKQLRKFAGISIKETNTKFMYLSPAMATALSDNP